MPTVPPATFIWSGLAPKGLLVFFGFQTADGRLFETLDKDRNVPATATVAWYHATMVRRMDYVRIGRTS